MRSNPGLADHPSTLIKSEPPVRYRAPAASRAWLLTLNASFRPPVSPAPASRIHKVTGERPPAPARPDGGPNLPGTGTASRSSLRGSSNHRPPLLLLLGVGQALGRRCRRMAWTARDAAIMMTPPCFTSSRPDVVPLAFDHQVAEWVGVGGRVSRARCTRCRRNASSASPASAAIRPLDSVSGRADPASPLREVVGDTTTCSRRRPRRRASTPGARRPGPPADRALALFVAIAALAAEGPRLPPGGRVRFRQSPKYESST